MSREGFGLLAEQLATSIKDLRFAWVAKRVDHSRERGHHASMSTAAVAAAAALPVPSPSPSHPRPAFTHALFQHSALGKSPGGGMGGAVRGEKSAVVDTGSEVRFSVCTKLPCLWNCDVKKTGFYVVEKVYLC